MVNLVKRYLVYLKNCSFEISLDQLANGEYRSTHISTTDSDLVTTRSAIIGWKYHNLILYLHIRNLRFGNDYFGLNALI